MSAVASNNPFALLLEEDSRPASPTPASKKKDAPASQPTRNTAKPIKGPASRGGQYYRRGGKPLRDSAQDNQDEAPAGGDDSAKKRVDGEGRGRGGRGRGRGGRGRGGGHGREFDRHSGTGRTDSGKQINQGWGADEGGAELKAEQAGTTDAQAEGAGTSTDDWGASAQTTDNWAAPAADDWGAPPPPEGDNAPAVEGEKGDDGRKPREREPEEEDNTISYDQYLAQLKENEAASVPKLEGVREANEGAGDWGDIVERKRNEEEVAYFVGKSKNTTKVRAEKKEKVYLEIDARFERPSRGGGRGRGGDRGRSGDRGRGGGRGGTRGGRANGSSQPVSVDDETAFPSLS